MIAHGSDTQRIGPLEPPYAAEVATTLQRLMGGVDAEPLVLFRTMAHHPVLLEKLRGTGTYLLNFGTVDPREREIVILRTCARCGCEYEWGVHVAIYSKAVGLTDAQVRATVVDDDTVWSERDRTLLRLTDELHNTAAFSDGLWEALRNTWRPDQLIELVTLAGQYHTVSFTANALNVALEDWAPKFPA